jgi:hypothetical protein
MPPKLKKKHGLTPAAALRVELAETIKKIFDKLCEAVREKGERKRPSAKQVFEQLGTTDDRFIDVSFRTVERHVAPLNGCRLARPRPALDAESVDGADSDEEAKRLQRHRSSQGW